MATRQKKNSRFSGLAVPAVCLCILGYYGFHAYQGSLGIKSRSAMEQKSLDLEFELARLHEEHASLKIKVGLLRNGRVEKDMLDQQARHLLNFVKANEYVIISGKN
ncbi:MAG: septum formation initiator family protein [Hyphomicrobiales bacterium]|nr:septum formation initiator family protein [Hyphomicrobiales bacterium]